MSNDTQPEIRFPGFTDEWEQRKLGELATIVRGASPRPIQDPKWFDTESDVGWLRIADVTEQDGRIYYLEQHISKLGQEKTRVLVEPHLLLSIAATVGKPVVNYVKTGVHDGFLIFLNAIFDREFMFQWLEMFRPKWQKYGQPGSQVNLNSELVRNQEILIPNNEEQQKIGSFFKQLDNTIALHQRKLDLLKETKKGFLQKMFPKNGAKVPEIRFPGFTEDWEERRLNDFISGDISDGDWIEKEHIKDEGKYRIIQTGNIGNGVYIDKEKSAKYMDQNSFDILKANEIFPGDLLVSRLAEPAGRTVILPNIEDRMVTAVDVTILRQNENFDAYFLLSQMNTSKILNKVSKNVSGTSHKRISRKNLEKVTIDSTSIEEQNKIGAFFKQLDDTIALHQRKLDLLKETKKGFLQKMFV
ncbi:restriction endonuclease subunit S [Enterococcus hirae]|uniref:restriction endonuclease subunit S n=1 Tax=Enterococcus hirae TaxID=1354 RepID=UPI0021E7ECA8|nr:restriction endonuclease subunit S [Enterococcus hirae]MCV3103805.1 restriction endonuclease subunit S [Enterococcus hirae]MCV3108726.1 restriction endonuclease subunit S [Enterococcus hirae]